MSNDSLMKVWVVTKSPVDLPGTREFIGVFTSRTEADKAIVGAGTYLIAEMDLNRRYCGDLFNVRVMHKLDHRQF